MGNSIAFTSKKSSMEQVLRTIQREEEEIPVKGEERPVPQKWKRRKICKSNARSRQPRQLCFAGYTWVIPLVIDRGKDFWRHALWGYTLAYVRCGARFKLGSVGLELFAEGAHIIRADRRCLARVCLTHCILSSVIGNLLFWGRVCGCFCSRRRYGPVEYACFYFTTSEVICVMLTWH